MSTCEQAISLFSIEAAAEVAEVNLVSLGALATAIDENYPPLDFTQSLLFAIDAFVCLHQRIEARVGKATYNNGVLVVSPICGLDITFGNLFRHVFQYDDPWDRSMSIWTDAQDHGESLH